MENVQVEIKSMIIMFKVKSTTTKSTKLKMSLSINSTLKKYQ